VRGVHRLVLLSVLTIAAGAEGWQYAGDLNGDGVSDHIKSGPPELFGNAGGPFVVELSKPDGSYQAHAIFAHRLCMAHEAVESAEGVEVVIWTYRRWGSEEGRLIRYELGDELEVSHLTIHPKTDVGKALYWHMVVAFSAGIYRVFVSA